MGSFGGALHLRPIGALAKLLGAGLSSRMQVLGTFKEWPSCVIAGSAKGVLVLLQLGTIAKVNLP